MVSCASVENQGAEIRALDTACCRRTSTLLPCSSACPTCSTAVYSLRKGAARVSGQDKPRLRESEASIAWTNSKACENKRGRNLPLCVWRLLLCGASASSSGAASSSDAFSSSAKLCVLQDFHRLRQARTLEAACSLATAEGREKLCRWHRYCCCHACCRQRYPPWHCPCHTCSPLRFFAKKIRLAATRGCAAPQREGEAHLPPSIPQCP